MKIQMPYGKLVCYHCGYWMKHHPQSSAFGISLNMASAIQKAFRQDHYHCKPSDNGREAWLDLHREWDEWMRANHKQREEWEKDYNTVWAPTDWALEYDEWSKREKVKR